MTANLIIVTGILLIAYAVYATVQKARGKSGSGCCGGPEAVSATMHNLSTIGISLYNMTDLIEA